jgi:hypothetical protein
MTYVIGPFSSDSLKREYAVLEGRNDGFGIG